MKKALVILLALSMVFAAFADEPAVVNEVASFTGNASVTWGVDLDAGKTGFKNAEEASLKFTLIGKGDKSTTGEGIWGELVIKAGDASEAEAKGADANVLVKKVSVDKAKIHINDMFAIGIREGGNKYGEYKPTLAVFSDKGHVKVDSVGGTVTDGITIEVKPADIVELSIDFRSIEQYTNQYGFGTGATIKPIDGLTVKAGFGMDFFGSNPWGLSASADYKLALSDTMYVKPQVGFTMTNAGNSGKIAGAVLVGWGSENQDTNIKWVSKKVSDGFSVAAVVPFASGSAIDLCAGVWDSTFVENLKVGAQFHAALGTTFAMKTLAFEFAYDLGNIKPSVAFAMDNSGDLGWTDAMKLFVGCDFTGFVANTTFTVAYESGNFKAATGKLGKLDLTAKISF